VYIELSVSFVKSKNGARRVSPSKKRSLDIMLLKYSLLDMVELALNSPAAPEMERFFYLI